jgi:hypothetical protein
MSFVVSGANIGLQLGWDIIKGSWRRGAKTSLFMSWDFRLAILIPVAVAAGLAAGIAESESLVLANALTQESIQLALENFRLPLGVLALAFPLAAMVASNLRSVQAVHQMELQQSQNNFANHYLHLEKFTEQMELHCNPPVDESSQDSVLMYRFTFRWQRVHSFFYPQTRKGLLLVPWTVVAFVENMVGVVEKAAIEVCEFGDTDAGREVRLDFFVKLTDFVGFMLLQFGHSSLKATEFDYWTRMMSDIAMVMADVEAGMYFDMDCILATTRKVITEDSEVFKEICASKPYSGVNQFIKAYAYELRKG